MATDELNLVADIPIENATLEGELALPPDFGGVVVFAHGSGSSRYSPRNNFVAEIVRKRGVGTLLFDLLTEAEDRDQENRFDIPLLTDRLVEATSWVQDHHAVGADTPIGYFGASTGAAAALRGAARAETDVDAVVSRGGRVDLADDAIDDVTVPTLLIVGGDDESVLERNRAVSDDLSDAELRVVEGTGHLFEGEGELESVAAHAADWFRTHLG